MKKTGAWLVRYALEQIGVKYTFGIPGVHNTEIYDELNNSEEITPILVTHEGHGAFMADAISRTTDHIGTMVIVPAAGATHAASGIGEAHLDGIPMLVISGGVRTDSDYDYQLHDMYQHKMLEPITKATFKVVSHQDIVPTLYQAYQIATQGEPGPVFVEVPVNIQLDKGEVSDLPVYQMITPATTFDNEQIQTAAQLLIEAKQPGLFLGWGAVDASEITKQLADLLATPVATTLQGLSAFPANHPCHTGMGIGRYAVPASEKAFANCDCLLAVGTRFSEIATGSFGIQVPEKLIHIDINPQVFHRNFPASVAIEGDAVCVLQALLAEVKRQLKDKRDGAALHQLIAQQKAAYLNEWRDHDSGGRINPGVFFESLRRQLDDDAYVVVDDGNHTFLAAELMPIYAPRHFISPTDFNCMGYAAPATVATKLGHPDKQVVSIIGDGAFMMSAMEVLTATQHGLGCVFIVFNDGELSQISQAQNIPYNRKTCTVLGNVRIKGIADATGAEYCLLDNPADVDHNIAEALKLAEQGAPVILDVAIDYSKKTRFTKGIVGTNLKRLNLNTKVRMVGRALVRRVTG